MSILNLLIVVNCRCLCAAAYSHAGCGRKQSRACYGR